MSRFFSQLKYGGLTPYTPGEQPGEKAQVRIKLNTNESPFAPSKKVLTLAAQHTRALNLYPDPECRELREEVAKFCHVDPSEILLTNGSDEILNFAFMAFCDVARPAAFPDITYGFYPVFAKQNGVPYKEIPLREDFTINVKDYIGLNRNIFIANPNAPTGLLLSVDDIREIAASNPDNVVVIDEAYIDFGGKSCVPLIRKYDNLLVTRTFSKAYSMAGARLGYGIANKSLIQDLNTLKYSTNPYNINSMSMAMGLAMLANVAFPRDNCMQICKTRAYFTRELVKRGFDVPDSMANFVLARSPDIGGEALYLALKKKGILVRHFDNPRIAEYNRITIGTRSHMDKLLYAIDTILEAGE